MRKNTNNFFYYNVVKFLAPTRWNQCVPAYLFLPSGSRENPTPASAEGAS